jgi:hypothetical protein
MRFASRAGLTVAAVAVILGLAGCGSSNGSLLTQGAATQLTAELNQASTELDQYNCLPAYTALTNFKDDVDQLTGVNATLVKMLTQGASTISRLANERCPSGASPDTTTSTGAATTTTGTTTSTSVTTTTSATTTSATSTDSGGAAPTTASTPAVTPPVVTTATQTEPTTTPDSGGAGLNGTGAAGSGGTGGGGGGAQ